MTWVFMLVKDFYYLTAINANTVDVLFNEKSMFCCLPKSLVQHHVSKLEGMENKIPSAEDIVKAKIVLEKATSPNIPALVFLGIFLV